MRYFIFFFADSLVRSRDLPVKHAFSFSAISLQATLLSLLSTRSKFSAHSTTKSLCSSSDHLSYVLLVPVLDSCILLPSLGASLEDDGAGERDLASLVPAITGAGERALASWVPATTGGKKFKALL